MTPAIQPPASARVAVAQMGCDAKDLGANVQRCLEAAARAKAEDVDLVVFPELCLTGVDVAGSVPELARRPSDPEILELADATRDGPSLLIGFIEDGGDGAHYNATAYLEDGHVVHVQRKLYLPSYGIFDEARAFCRGERFGTFPTRFGRAASLICEDAWHSSLPYIAVMGGATLLLTTSASPVGGTSGDVSSAELWMTVNRSSAVTLKCFNVYANRTGDEGHLHYWGGSHVIAPTGKILAQGPIEEDALVVADLDLISVARERYAYRYVQDERLSLTLRELQNVAQQRWRTP